MSSESSLLLAAKDVTCYSLRNTKSNVDLETNQNHS